MPFGEATETFTVTFHPRNRTAAADGVAAVQGRGGTTKTAWVDEVHGWGTPDGRRVALVTAVRWGDESPPWAVLRTEDVLYDADLSAYIRAEGP